jgi:hypothetical protein
LPRTLRSSDKVAAMSAVLLLADAAKEGKDVVLSMLVVGLVFLAVIGIGEFFDWRQRRRMKARA